jgi:Chaperone of endosialidase
MKPLIKFNQVRKLSLVPLMLACFGLLPQAQTQTNTAYGNGALVSLTSGVWNSGFGFEALNHDTAGNQNTATGLRALTSDTNGGFNTATGVYSLFSNTSGFFNSATGAYSLANNISGSNNTANGYGALYRNTADANTANGFGALYKNTTGFGNTATGVEALFSTTSDDNTAIGFEALLSNTTGFSNTAIGSRALQDTTGNDNTAIGYQAGSTITGSGNICIGPFTGFAGEDNTTRIGNIYETVQPVVGVNPDYVTVDSLGRLGRANVSSRRYKHDIKSMDRASDVIFALKPVSFRYNREYDATQTIAFGLIAEEVAEVYPALVGRNDKGQPESVRYEQINAMLLNEFLKEHKAFLEEHRKVEKLEAAVSGQQKQIQTLAAGLEKVNSQVGLGKSVPTVVSNNR